MKKVALWVITLLLVSLTIFTGNDRHPYSPALKSLPVQDGGRIKPYDTFAREALELVYGKAKFEGKPAGEIVFTWMLQPEAWQEKSFIEIRHHLVKRALKLPEEQRYFQPKEIMASDRLTTIFQELSSKREAKEKLDPYNQAVQRLEGQLVTFREMAAGRLLRIVPPKEGDTWISVSEFDERLHPPFLEVTKSFIGSLGDKSKEAEQKLNAAVENFVSVARAESPEKYPELKDSKVEVLYNEGHPFRHAYMAYLLSGIFLALLFVLGRPELMTQAWLFAGLGMIFHILGFFLRTYLTGRAPVSNMYETVVWVGFGSVLFAMVIEKIYQWRFILAAGTLVGAFCLIIADSAPAILDSGLQPLEPVLRSNFWLTTHVLTITISYAAFFLAFALGDIGLVLFFRDEKRYRDQIRAVVLAIYRSIQIGVSFLAPGIILGGIWADYSWGRFWGWDPKETWALIALLGYMAVLHGRLAGWVQSFGMVASAVVTFSLVIMAWYGVNYVLGAGLHTYGFGAGGVEYVAGFVAVHLLAVVYVGLVRYFEQRKLKPARE